MHIHAEVQGKQSPPCSRISAPSGKPRWGPSKKDPTPVLTAQFQSHNSTAVWKEAAARPGNHHWGSSSMHVEVAVCPEYQLNTGLRTANESELEAIL